MGVVSGFDSFDIGKSSKLIKKEGCATAGCTTATRKTVNKLLKGPRLAIESTPFGFDLFAPRL